MPAKWRDVHRDVDDPEIARRYKAALRFLGKVGGQADWGELDPGDPHGCRIPIPESYTFDYPAPDAQLLARTCDLVLRQPVVLSGGGGGGAAIWILLETRVIENFPHKPGEWHGRLESEDLTKPPTSAVVEATLHRPPGVTANRLDAMGEVFTPHLASWKLTALRGFGAERVEANWPEYSTGDRLEAYRERQRGYEAERAGQDPGAGRLAPEGED
jgi:hypothetical protein